MLCVPSRRARPSALVESFIRHLRRKRKAPDALEECLGWLHLAIGFVGVLSVAIFPEISREEVDFREVLCLRH
jgi:hypothetical protein